MNVLPLNSDLKEVLKTHKFKEPITKIILSEIVSDFFESFSSPATIELLDSLKELGFKYSTQSGVTISLFDLLEQKTDKETLFSKTEAELEKVSELFEIGGVTKQENRQGRIKR